MPILSADLISAKNLISAYLNAAGLAFNVIADRSRLLEAHLTTSKILKP